MKSTWGKINLWWERETKLWWGVSLLVGGGGIFPDGEVGMNKFSASGGTPISISRENSMFA